MRRYKSGVGEFDGGKVAITGAAGFIGAATALRFAAEGARVTGIDLAPLPAELSEAGVEPARLDVTDRAALIPAFAGADLVVHAAALVHEHGAIADFVRVNVGGTAAVLDAAASAGVARAVHLSSVVVFGYESRSEQGEESFRRNCGIPYIDTKSAADRLACRRGAVVVRPGDVYGPGSIPWTVRPLALARVGRLAVPGAGSGTMLPVYVDDLVEAILLGAKRGAPGRAYTAWEGVSVSFGEYLDAVARIAGGRPARRAPRPLLELAGAALEGWARIRGTAPEFTSRSPTFVDRRGSVSIKRIRSELGWEPRVPLAEGLRRSADWARAARLVRD
jgi:nucleoside-diphosphate-sugar epimerase